MPKSLYLSNKLLNQLFNGTAYTFPTTVYIALYTAAPASDGTGGTEVAGGAYARQAMTCDAGTFPVTTTGQVSNAAALDFPAATANWGTIVAAAIKDALSAGNTLYHNELDTARTVNNGDAFSFAIDQLLVQES